MKILVLSAVVLVALLSAVFAEGASAPRVILETSMGRIALELYPDKAPKTLKNFLQYVDDGFYDGTIFHRVIDGFMIQGGGFTVDMTQKPTRGTIPNEADNGLKNLRGTVAMARRNEPDSATAQFFVNAVDNGSLDHTRRDARGWGYTVFGRVVEGMEVVDAIAKVATGSGDVPRKPVIIRRVSRQAPEEGSS